MTVGLTGRTVKVTRTSRGCAVGLKTSKYDERVAQRHVAEPSGSSWENASLYARIVDVGRDFKTLSTGSAPHDDDHCESLAEAPEARTYRAARSTSASGVPSGPRTTSAIGPATLTPRSKP